MAYPLDEIQDTSPETQILGDFLRYLPAYRVLVCKQHGAVRSWASHLETAHHYKKKERDALDNLHQISSLLVVQPKDIALPPPNQRPIPELGSPQLAFLCSVHNCGFKTISRNAIGRHYNKDHNWRSSKEDRSPWTSIRVQTFFREGGLQRYFQVQPTLESESSSLGTTTTDEVAQIIQEIERSRAQDAESFAIADATIAKTDHTGWFKRNRWPTHLACSNLAHLSQASYMPSKDDTILSQAVTIVDQVIEQAVAGLDKLGGETARWLRSPNPEQIERRPMARLQNPESLKRYSSYMKRFICYLLRVLNAEQAGDQDSESDTSRSQAGVESEPDSDTKSQTGPSIPSRDKMYDAKRLFPWSGDQKHLAQLFVHSLQLDGEGEQIACLLRLFESFIFHITGDEPFKSGLIHFLAVLSIDETTNRLREAQDYSYMLAGVVYCTRVLALEILLPAAEHELQGEPDRLNFLNVRKQYLVDGTYSPFSEMISLLAYSKHIALNSANAPMSMWSIDKSTLYIHGQPIQLTAFQAMVASVLQRAEDCLWENLLWTPVEAARFQMSLNKIQDDVTLSLRGYSFLSRPDNELVISYQEAIHRMMASPDGRKLRRAHGQAWNPQEVRRYLRQVERFLELLLFLTHVTGGQPARGTEITTARHRNGYMQDRNIYVLDGQVVFISRYHKSQAIWDKPKVIPRFLPWRVGQLFAVFLSYVQPLSEYLNKERLGISPTDYVWATAAGPWDTSRLSQIIARETEIWLGCKLTTLQYRHAAITIGREVVSKDFSEGTQEALTEGDWEEPEMQLESGLDLQAGRTELTGTLRYGVEMGIVAHLSHRSLQVFQRLSARWHSFLQLSSALPTALTPISIIKRPETLSKEKHVPVASPLDSLPKNSSSYAAIQRIQGEVKPATISDSELQALVQKVVQKEGLITFKSSEQELALRAILAGETPLVVVLPTGGGKSLLFMAPACLSSPGITIVVVPFRELIRDLKDRLAEAKIQAVEWVPGSPTNHPAPVVLVSADTAGGFEFLTWATVLHQGGWIKRIVIDECHLTFTSYDWRPRLAHLSRLRSFSAQLILLTATQPPMLEYELGEVMHLRTPRYIRAATLRPNTRYLVQRCQRGGLNKAAVGIARRWLAQLRGKEKAIIYCRTRPQCDKLGQLLDCPVFHAGLAPDDRSKAMNTWLQSGGLIVATSSLGTGIDYPCIVRVLHVDLPYGMIDFAQESGRAGRGGEFVDSVILVDKPREAMPLVTGLVDHQWRTLDEGAIQNFIHAGPGACRRNIMSLYLDGQSAICTKIQAANCDLCGDGATEFAAASSQQAQEEAKIREVLQELVNGCPVCWLRGSSNWLNHLHYQCEECTGVFKAYSWKSCEQVRQDRLIQWNKATHTCFKCGLSQHFCATGQDAAKKCQWPGIMIPVLLIVAKHGEQLLGRMGLARDTDVPRTLTWLTQKHNLRKWGAVVTNAMVALAAVLIELEVLQHIRCDMSEYLPPLP